MIYNEKSGPQFPNPARVSDIPSTIVLGSYTAHLTLPESSTHISPLGFLRTVGGEASAVEVPGPIVEVGSEKGPVVKVGGGGSVVELGGDGSVVEVGVRSVVKVPAAQSQAQLLARLLRNPQRANLMRRMAGSSRRRVTNIQEWLAGFREDDEGGEV
jgi:hypothetical protein